MSMAQQAAIFNLQNDLGEFKAKVEGSLKGYSHEVNLTWQNEIRKWIEKIQGRVEQIEKKVGINRG